MLISIVQEIVFFSKEVINRYNISSFQIFNGDKETQSPRPPPPLKKTLPVLALTQDQSKHCVHNREVDDSEEGLSEGGT